MVALRPLSGCSTPLSSSRISRRMRSTTMSSGTLFRASGYRSNRSISPVRRARLITCSRIIWMRVSSSPVTEGRTNASDTCSRSTLTFAHVGMRQHDLIRGDDPLKRFDFCIRDRCQAIPPPAEDSRDPSRFQDLDVAGLVHHVMDEQIAGKHRACNQTPDSRAPRPDLHHRQKGVKVLSLELVVHELLTVTVRPDCEPSCVQQGFAPFGSSLPFSQLEPHACAN